MSCADAARPRLSGRGSDRALYASIAHGVGAEAVAGAAVLWLTGAPPRADRVSVTPKVGAGFAGLTARFGF